MEMEKTKEKRDSPEFSKRAKLITTLVIYFGNISYACAINSFSPALTDFKNKYETDTEEVSVVFTAAVGCYLVGALLSAFIYSFINRQLTVVFLFGGMTAAMVAAPHIPTVVGFYFVGGLLGLCIGAYDTAQIVWVMEMWESASGPYIQGQHFFYALGTVLSPVIISPFLKTKFGDEDDGNAEENERLFVPFTIIGCLCGTSAILQLLLFIFIRYRPPSSSQLPPSEESLAINNSDESKKTKKGIKKCLNLPNWPTCRLIILCALSLGFYQGMEMCTFNMFPTYGQRSELQLSESKSADTLAALTAAFATGRGLCILLILKIPPQFIFSVNILLATIANIILIGWGHNSVSYVWAAAILYGLGFSSFMPCFYTYMEKYLILSDAIGAIMVVTGSVVGGLYPLIVGMFIDDKPVVITYPVFISIGVLLCTVTLTYLLTRGKTTHINARA